MKYYKNLIKEKRYALLAFIVLWDFIALSLILTGARVLLSHGIHIKGLFLAFSENTGISMLPLGLAFLWLGVCFLPVVSPYAQDKEDFAITIKKERVMVAFKNYYFEFEKSQLPYLEMPGRDFNNKRVGIVKRSQIFNFLQCYYSYLFKK